METLEAIHTRRSVRKFENRSVPDELVHKILEAAMCAPSAMNEQPWHFIVIKGKGTHEEIPKFSPYAAMAKNAPLAILVCGETKLEKAKGFWVQDCSAAIQNILLATHSLGLGAVWTAAYPWKDREDGYRKLLGIPEGVIPLALIVIGYSAQKAGKADRFKKERVHKELW
ncbi:MAG: nitroreductase family protein [Candidatus Micrarchaeota archaeon]